MCDKIAKSLMPQFKSASSDPLEEFCKNSPDSEECKVFED